jgi:hypothetical protein
MAANVISGESVFRFDGFDEAVATGPDRASIVQEEAANPRDVGVRHLLCQTGFGDMSHEQNLLSMRRFGEQVMPAFRS